MSEKLDIINSIVKSVQDSNSLDEMIESWNKLMDYMDDNNIDKTQIDDFDDMRHSIRKRLLACFDLHFIMDICSYTLSKIEDSKTHCTKSYVQLLMSNDENLEEKKDSIINWHNQLLHKENLISGFYMPYKLDVFINSPFIDKSQYKK